MMTATRTELDAPLRELIERRLDAIDHILLSAGVSRGERCGIVEEVEGQIYEMLARRTDEPPTRRDVLAVLSALDPPEAYAPEGYRVAAARVAEQPAGPRPSLLACGAAVVGAIDLLLLALCGLMVLGEVVEGDLLLLALVVLGFCIPLAVTVCGLVSLLQIQTSAGRLFGLPAAMFATSLFPLLLLNVVIGSALMMFDEEGLMVFSGLSLLAGNVWLVGRIWKWASGVLRPPAAVAATH